MPNEDLLSRLSEEEKYALLTGSGNMGTAPIERLGIPEWRMADGPHGVRNPEVDDCVAFPCLTAVAATFDRALVYRMGEAIAEDCIAHGVDLILGPGVNIKRTPLCGRNFEYLSEDPVHAGEMAAAYIRGVQSRGVGTCLKHFAMNNQERDRLEISVEAEERVMREIYLKAFEIALRKSEPYSIMCAYNRVGAVPCAESRYLLTRVLKEEWGYRGCVLSDWGAVRDPARSVAAGLDLVMPKQGGMASSLKAALQNGTLSQEAIDEATRRVLGLAMRQKPKTSHPYTREEKHAIAREVARDGIVLLRNEKDTLPLTSKKYKKIAVIGEYAENALIMGQGSAEVHTAPRYLEQPLAELRAALGEEVEVTYLPVYSRRSLPDAMIWPNLRQWWDFVDGADAVLVFAGGMESEDTEQFDRRTAELNPNFEFVIDAIAKRNPHVTVVLQSGSALILGSWRDRVAAILHMWLGGEGAGGAIADVLTGKVSPSGKLPESFPAAPRRDLEYPGDGLKIRYSEGFEVGYRYYDRHPDEIAYPFGFGLTYSRFAFRDFAVTQEGELCRLTLTAQNVGEYDAAEVLQVYAGKPESGVSRSLKDLITFEKITLKAGEEKELTLTFPVQDLAYFNAMLASWTVEPGSYRITLATSSRDSLFEAELSIDVEAPFSVNHTITAMIG